jgi:hypothetical protein
MPGSVMLRGMDIADASLDGLFNFSRRAPLHHPDDKRFTASFLGLRDRMDGGLCDYEGDVWCPD